MAGSNIKIAGFGNALEEWTEKAKRNALLVVQGSAEDLFEIMTRRQPSVKETGGSFVVGKVPVDTGHLIGTSQAEINGSVVAKGSGAGTAPQPADWTAAVQQMKLGDTIVGGFTADYARHVEYGTHKMAGRFFVREALSQWPRIVEENARFIGED